MNEVNKKTYRTSFSVQNEFLTSISDNTTSTGEMISQLIHLAINNPEAFERYLGEFHKRDNDLFSTEVLSRQIIGNSLLGDAKNLLLEGRQMRIFLGKGCKIKRTDGKHSALLECKVTNTRNAKRKIIEAVTFSLNENISVIETDNKIIEICFFNAEKE